MTEEYKRIIPPSVLFEAFDYVSALSSKIKHSLKEYTGDEFEKLNKRLRKGKILKPEHQNIMKDIDEAFKGVPPIEKSLVLYRGISKDFIPDLKAFLSTSYDKEKALSYVKERSDMTKCCLLEITVPSGSKVLPLELVSYNSFEREVLLPRTGDLVITNIIYQKNLKIYTISYLPKSSVELSRTNSKESFKDIEKNVSIEDWADRILSVITTEDIELLGDPQTIVELAIESFDKEKIPKKAINIAITRLKTTLYINAFP